MNKEFYLDKYYKLEELKINVNIKRHIVQRSKGIWKNIVIFGAIITIVFKLTDLKILNNDIYKTIFLIIGS